MSNDKLKIKEIKTFTAQDMIDFGIYCRIYYKTRELPKKSVDKLLGIWEEKRVPAIKSTSELGCMLDTERQWTELPREINAPNDTRDVEVMLKDGTITFGWLGGCWWVDDKKGYERSSLFPKENPNNPVVAWRELQ